MAVVHLARQRGLERLVALKELRAIDSAEPTLIRRFLRESRVAASLEHPNIVTVYEAFEDAGMPYIAMEYLPAGSLRPFVGRLSFPQVVGVLEDVLAALSHAERAGIVHRDIKPENIMVTSDGHVKLADFGIAKASRSVRMSTFMTAAGTTLGTPSYMAPEQAMAQEVGPATDLYAVGCAAYELSTGRLPFAGVDEPMALLLRHINEDPEPAASVDPSVDPRISAWIDELLRKDPRERPPGAAVAWAELEEIAIAIAGPRWRREARLPPAAPGAVPGPYTPPPEGPAPTGEPFSNIALPPVDSPVPIESGAPPLDEPPAPAGISGRRRGRTLAIAGVALLAVAGVVAVVLSGSGSDPPDTPPSARAAQQSAPVTTGGLSFEPPAGWARRSEPVQVPGLDLTRAASVGPGEEEGDGSATIGFARAGAHRPSLLPASLTAALGMRPGLTPERKRVQLAGGLEAYRYDGLRPRGYGRPVTVYAAPTSRGVATLACSEPDAGAERFAADCEALANSLSVTGATAYPLGPSEDFAAAVNGALDRLARVPRLGEARTARAQATAAEAVAGGYEDARAALERLEVSPADAGARAALVRALRTAGGGYRDLAAAARRTQAGRYRAAAAAAERGDAELAAALGALKRTGYRRLVTEDFRARQVPAMKRPPAPAPTATPTVAPPQPTPTAQPAPRPTATPTPFPTFTGPGGPCIPPSCIPD
jgi:hypothetical protein